MPDKRFNNCGAEDLTEETERERILGGITKRVTRDDGTQFVDSSRLDYIKAELSESDYEILCETPLSVIYKKKNGSLRDTVVLLSSHIDCVREISKPDFKAANNGIYEGTFDNAATNSAAVMAMLENRLSGNILISFTGDEEEHSKGAAEVIKYLEKCGKHVIAISLDATFDLVSETDDGISSFAYASYTIDNLCKNTEESIARLLFKTANELGIPYMVTRAGDEDYFGDKEDEIPDYYAEELEAEDIAYEDEAITFAENQCCIAAFSLCIPTSDTDDRYHMHSNHLIKIKKKTFDEYIEAMTQISNKMAEESCDRISSVR